MNNILERKEEGMQLQDAVDIVGTLKHYPHVKVAITNPYLFWERSGVFLTVGCKTDGLKMHFPTKSVLSNDVLCAVLGRSTAFVPTTQDFLRTDWFVVDLVELL